MPGGGSAGAFADWFLQDEARLRLGNVERLGREAGGINREREAEARAFGQELFASNTGRTFDEDRFNSIFAAEASRGVGDFLGAQDALSESLGIRGTGGGVAAQQAGNLFSAFQNNLAESKGNLRLAQIQSDFADSQRNLSAGADLRNFLAQPTDETELATQAASFQGFAELGGILANRDAGIEQSRAIRRAGEPDFLDYFSAFAPLASLPFG